MNSTLPDFLATSTPVGHPLYLNAHHVPWGSDSVRGAVADFKARFFGQESCNLQGIASDILAEISSDDHAYQNAIHKMAARAEYIRGAPAEDQRPNPYHNTPHTGDVSVWVHYIAKGLEPKQRLLLQLVAFAHDVDHLGCTNDIEGPFVNEERSISVLEAIMQEEGLPEEDIQVAKLMLLATSPNGGFQYLKGVAHALNNGDEPDHDAIVEQVWAQVGMGQPDDVKALWAMELEKLKPLSTSHMHVVDTALLLHAADILPSVLVPKNGILLTIEQNHEAAQNPAKSEVDFTTPGAAIFFLENVVTREMFEISPQLQEFLPVFDEVVRDNYALQYQLESFAADPYEGPRFEQV